MRLSDVSPVTLSPASYAIVVTFCPTVGQFGTTPWSDATTPRTDKPLRFVAHAARPDYRTFRGVSGLSSHIVRLPA